MAQKGNATNEDLEMDQMAEAELSRLQRQYRIMEGDRQAYSEEVKVILQKQRKSIEKLEKEKEELVTALTCVKSAGHEARDAKNTTQLKELLEMQDRLDQAIRYEQSQLGELQFQIAKVEKEIRTIKSNHGVKESNLDEIREELRAEQQLENRLDVATVKFNRLLASNHRLRDEIDHLLKERTFFNQVYQDLTNRLNSGKKIMMDLIEQSTLAYDQREEAQAKLEALKQRGKQDLLIHSQEMRELQRKLDHDSKLHEFLGVKGQKRIMADLEAKEALKKQQEREALEAQMQKYQSILEQIREFCGEQDVDRLSAQFLKQEEENFALFNYVNELNNELEMLQEQVKELQANIEEQREINKARAQQQQATLQTLELELVTRRDEADKAKATLDHCRDVINKLMDGIHKAFMLLIHDSNPVLQLLGENTTVTTFNVMLYLGIIQKRSEDLSAVVNGWRAMKREEEQAALQLLRKPATTKTKSSAGRTSAARPAWDHD